MSFAEDFAKALNEKFSAEYEQFGRIEVRSGRRFDKLVMVTTYQSVSVFAFVEKATGDLYKAAGWSAPAKHKRYNGNELLNMAVADADPYGRFLYIN